MSETKISIQLNGRALDVPQGTSVTGLLKLAEIRSQVVAVEVNMEIVPRDQHADFHLSEGDVIEAVTLVGGG